MIAAAAVAVAGLASQSTAVPFGHIQQVLVLGLREMYVVKDTPPTMLIATLVSKGPAEPSAAVICCAQMWQLLQLVRVIDLQLLFCRAS